MNYVDTNTVLAFVTVITPVELTNGAIGDLWIGKPRITHGVGGTFIGKEDDAWDGKAHMMCDWPTARGVRNLWERREK